MPDRLCVMRVRKTYLPFYTAHSKIKPTQSCIWHPNSIWRQVSFYVFLHPLTVAIAQLVRASDCGSEGRGFEPH